VRVAHLADLHLRKEKHDDIRIALDSIIEDCREFEVDLIVIAGDTWDGTIHNTRGSHFPYFLEKMRQLANIAPIAMIYGTPSHDTEGSLEVFETLDSKHSITILRPGIPYVVEQGKVYKAEEATAPEMLLLGIPEPNKKWLLSQSDSETIKAADEAAANSLQKFLTSLAALRAEFQTIQCITLYHGRIRGSKFSNGQIVEDGVSYQDLEQIGAEYYALGDIHEPQEITAAMRYPGSIYSCNWGETHKPGWNMIELDRSRVAPVLVQRREIPLPQQKKITVEYGRSWDEIGIEGKRVWLEVKCDRSDKVDTDQILETLYSQGAVQGSRVTLSVKPIETVRAAEITEQIKLREKVKLYSEASGLTVSESILEKCDSMEQWAGSEKLRGSSHIKIEKLRLRGAIGIWKGQKKDEIDLDLTSYEEGLISLIGRNGAGKSTLIENLHPWPQLLTRSEKLQDQFRLKDSYRELLFTDTLNQKQYRSLLKIDGKNASGTVEYYLYVDEGVGFVPYTGINGRREPYIQAIDDIFGSLSLFLKSAFISQRPSKANPDLAEATKGEKKELFVELAGLDYLQAYHEFAKGKQKACEDEISSIQAKIEVLDQQLKSKSEKEFRIEALDSELKNINETLVSLHANRFNANATVELSEKRYQHAVELKSKIIELMRQRSDRQVHLGNIEIKITEFQTALCFKDDAQANIELYEKLREEANELQKEKSTILERFRGEVTKWQDSTKIVRDNEQTLRTQETDFSRKLLDARTHIQAYLSSKEALTREIKKLENTNTECPTCGQDLPEESLKQIKEELEKLSQKLKDENGRISDWEEVISEFEQELTKIKKEIADLDFGDEPVVPDTRVIDSRLKGIDDNLFGIDREKELFTLQTAERAESDIKLLQADQRRIEKEIIELTTKIDDAKSEYDEEAEQRYSEHKKSLETLEFSIRQAELQQSSLNARITELRSQLEEYQKFEVELAEYNDKHTEKVDEKSEWLFLEKACSKDGIQALELDALSPSIAGVANRILEAAYGARFSIEFRTTRMSGSGSKTKQIETFDILVFDNENGTEQKLETLSGGESVWIKKAIYDAFGIIRARNTGQKFLTAFQDEADGALDPEAKEHYFRMLEGAHSESGRHQTIIITHSPEIQEMIQQSIDMTKLESLQIKFEEVAV
jgi:exonuclease SbcC